MEIVVVDCEFTGNVGYQEITQIGAVALNVKNPNSASQEMFNEYLLTLRPPTEEVVKLTGVTNDHLLAHGALPNLALSAFWKFVGRRPLYSYGNDVDVLAKLATDTGTAVQSRALCDISQMINVLRCAYPNAKSRGGLRAACELFGLEWEGRQHDALCDALMTAKLLCKVVADLRQLDRIRALAAEAL